MKNLGEKLREVEKKLKKGKIIQRSIEKRKRRNEKRLRDFKAGEEGKNKLILRWQGKEQDAD